MRNKKCRILLIKGSILFIIFLIFAIAYKKNIHYLYTYGNEFILVAIILLTIGSIISGIAFWYRYALCLIEKKFWTTIKN